MDSLYARRLTAKTLRKQGRKNRETYDALWPGDLADDGEPPTAEAKRNRVQRLLDAVNRDIRELAKEIEARIEHELRP